MNTLQFRIWDFCSNSYLEEGALFDISECNFGDGEIAYERFTGFYDKKKKPICEGDIVKFKYSVGDFAWEYMDEEEIKQQTKMLDKEYTVTVEPQLVEKCNLWLKGKAEIGEIIFPLSYAQNSKIVGNIHE